MRYHFAPVVRMATYQNEKITSVSKDEEKLQPFTLWLACKMA